MGIRVIYVDLFYCDEKIDVKGMLSWYVRSCDPCWELRYDNPLDAHNASGHISLPNLYFMKYYVLCFVKYFPRFW